MEVIYRLVDPRTRKIRYIGATQDIYARFAQHARCTGNNARKNAWIQDLKDSNELIVMEKLEEVQTSVEAREREAYWIHHYLHLGEDLLHLPQPLHVKPFAVQRQLVGKYNAAHLKELETSSSLVEAVKELRLQGYGQDDIVLKLWGVRKGGSPKYKEARKRYQDIVMFIETGQWPEVKEA